MVIDISLDIPHIPTAPRQAFRVTDTGIATPAKPIVAAVPETVAPVTAAVMVLTTHLRIKGLVIPKVLPTKRKTMDFQNFPIESLCKTKGLI